MKIPHPMPWPHSFVLTWLGCLLACPLAAEAQDRYLTLEAYSNQREIVGSMQQWNEVLGKCGVDRIRVKSSAFPPDPKVEEFKDGPTASSILVIGRIEGRKLVVPGGNFQMGDVNLMKAYFMSLKKDGMKTALADKKAFGLTSEQLVDVHSQLSAPIEISTRGEPIQKILTKLLGQQKLEVVFHPAAQRSLLGDETVREEFKGMSIGTGIAAIIRPLGLVIAPQRQQGDSVKLHILEHDRVEENWPIGWPSEAPVSQLAPGLSRKMNLEIRGFTLEQTLSAIEGRAGVPFLYDHNGMARQEIDPTTTKVTYVNEKGVLITAIRKMLSQARPRLKHELRMDENGKPFLWISPMSQR